MNKIDNHKQENNLKHEEMIIRMGNIQVKNRFRYIDYLGKLYSWIGICLSFFGLIYFLFATLGINLSNKQIYGLAAFICGVYLIFIVKVITEYKKIRLENKYDFEIKQMYLEKFISKWSEFENICRKIFSSQININTFSIKDMINNLYKREYISENENSNLIMYLYLRNNFVHGTNIFPASEMIDATLFLDKIIKKISQYSGVDK